MTVYPWSLKMISHPTASFCGQGLVQWVKEFCPRFFFLQLPEAEETQPLSEDCPAVVLGLSHQAVSGSSCCSHPRWALALPQAWAFCLAASSRYPSNQNSTSQRHWFCQLHLGPISGGVRFEKITRFSAENRNFRREGQRSLEHVEGEQLVWVQHFCVWPQHYRFVLFCLSWFFLAMENLLHKVWIFNLAIPG